MVQKLRNIRHNHRGYQSHEETLPRLKIITIIKIPKKYPNLHKKLPNKSHSRFLTTFHALYHPWCPKNNNSTWPMEKYQLIQITYSTYYYENN